MFGSKYSKAAMVLALIAFTVVGTASAERKLPGREFRVGLDLEPGFKFVNGSSFSIQFGLMLKFNEAVSLIPHFGMHPYEYESEYSFYGYTFTDTLEETAANIGLTLRFEKLTAVPTRNTRYEFDTESEEFVHYQYYRPLRPYFQAHLGTFMGAGAGVNYYITGNTAMGLGIDIGYNLQAEESAGMGVIPKAIVMIGF